MRKVGLTSIAISLCHLLFIACVIWLCFHLAKTYESADTENIRITAWSTSLIIVGSVCLAWSSIKLWLAYLDVFVQHRIPMKLALIGVGASLVAKYLPGKVWGVVAKTFLYKKERLDAGQVFASSVLEIYGSVAFAAAIGGIFYLAAILKLKILGVMLMIILAVLVSGFVFFAPAILLWSGVHRYLRINIPKADWKLLRIVSLAGWSWIYWGCFAAIIAMLWQEDADYGCLLGVMGAYLISVTAGFLVVLIPGGVGVREGVFVFLAQQLIDSHVAFQLAAIMRIWACVYDLVFGAVSYLVYLHFQNQP